MPDLLDLFHVSRDVYPPGKLIRLSEDQKTRFHEMLAGRTDGLAGEERLQRYRPDGAQSRLRTQYAFGAVGDCRLFGETQYRNTELHYYRVRMPHPTKVPMVLVDVVKRVDGRNEEEIRRLAEEYWQPTLPWEVWEYLDEEMEIVEEVPAPSDGSWEFTEAVCSWDNDVRRAATFLGATVG